MRTSVKFIAVTAAVAAAVLGSAAANANPISFYYSFDGGATYTQFGTTSTTGTNSASFVIGNFTVGAQAFGSPTYTAPNFQTTSLDVSATTAGNLIVAVEESGLTTPGISGFQLGFTSNLGTTLPMTETFAVINGSTYTALASATLQPSSATTDYVPYTVIPNYTAVELYTITFGAAGGTINSTISESAIVPTPPTPPTPPTTVPEPMSLSVLGAGLAGLGLIRLRKKVR